MYISKNKKQQITSKIGRFLEPFALGILCLLFIIPALTFSNLTPLIQKINPNVLGTKDEIGFGIELVGGSHNVFQNEHLLENEDGSYKYDTKILNHASGDYSKPILLIENISSIDKSVTFSGRTEIPIGSRIGIIHNNKFHVLQDNIGETTEVTLSLDPLNTTNIFLSVEAFSDVHFQETFYMDISFN
jgi:hypothetical protein